ncbi:MAG: site-2 protease family protein [Proteocatella sp.]
MLNNYLIDFLMILPGVLIAISFHEFAHAAAAYAMGDPTAKNEGRLSVNPAKHIDPIGFLMLMIARFGWAKPVPVNESNFKNRALGTFLVSIAGIAMNVFIAILTIIIVHFTQGIFSNYAYYEVMSSIIRINIAFAAFNLLPVPPLDGSKLVLSIIPAKYRHFVYKYENYGTLILVLLLITGTLGIVLNPIVNVIITFISSILNIIL